ncbi:Glucosidase 2 subunit beta [Zalerion maritima]|uniref:Glucosidase 2 subunit beta n=1 Tax=Zalerion maritima TaxID=339359 RepID=A0AAD5RLL0_9PEZI|nr:Glucosidase 2 subunit beta [Zalerion maritima]
MRHLDKFVLASTVASTAYASSSLPRGVSPEFAKFYSATDSFQCIGNPAIVVKSSQINDGSCDCPDGSDEPGTPACAHLDVLSPPQPLAGSPSGSTNTTAALPGFWCSNVGHIGMYVPFMFVNDGVCDYDLCCDGTEEYAGVGGIKCENRCKKLGEDYRRIQKEKVENLERATKKRRTMVKEAKELRRQVEAKITKMKAEVQQLQDKEADLKKKYEEVKETEAGKVVKGDGGPIGVLVGLAKARIEGLKDTLEAVVTQRDGLQSRVEELEDILTKFKYEYNPNFNDEGVKAAVHSWEDYAARIESEPSPEVPEQDINDALKQDNEASGIDWKSFELLGGSDTDILYSFEAYLPEFLREMIHEKILGLRVWMIENGILADNPTSTGESALVTAAREAYEAVGKDIKTKENDVKNEKKDLDKDYGPEHIFRYLKDKCVKTDVGEYEYELCWMGKTSQKSKKGHGNTNMGTFARIEVHDSDEEERADGKGLGAGPRLVLKYEDGQGCWNGPRRSTDVWLACAETEELWRVAEAEKCVYRMEVGTPAACDSVKHPESEEPKHDEL